jgi:hypothetical protein
MCVELEGVDAGWGVVRPAGTDIMRVGIASERRFLHQTRGGSEQCVYGGRW